MTTYQLDGTVQRFDTVVIGGSPLKLFRLTERGAELFARLVAGGAVPASKLVDTLIDAGVIHPVPQPGPYTSADVTIVVPALGPPAVVPAGAIVVDDGSRPPVDGATVRLDRNRGAGAARNAGLELVDTPLVAFVDSDVDLPPNWLDELLPQFSDDRVALVAPRVLSPPGDGIADYEHRHSPLDLGSEPAIVRAGSRVGYVPAAALVCRTAAIRSVGGFDPSLRFGEDVDVVWRLGEAGWRCRYQPRSTVLHAPRTTWRAWVRQRIGYGSSAAPLSIRHPGALAPLRMSGWSVLSWLLIVIGRPMAGVAVGVGSAAALVRKLHDVPPRDAFRLAAVGNLHAGGQIAEAIRRAWWPLLGIAAIRSRVARRTLIIAMLAARHPIVAVDDVAYSIGVWKGMVAERTAAPLIPHINSWPGRSTRI